MRAQRGAGFGIVSYAVMAVVIVLILIGGLLLVNAVGSSEPAGSTASGAVPTSTREGPLTCPDSLWLDAATQTCVARAECVADQTYDEVTNTCRVATVAGVRIDAISPSSGLSTGGTEVRVSGIGFEPGADVLIDDIKATSVDVVSDTVITAVTPGSKNLYPVDLEVANPDAEPVVLDNAFTYVAPPVKRITGINPPTGSQQGGETVVIKGVDFADGAVVSFFGRPATDVVVVNSTTLRATTPAGPVGPVNVNLRNPGEDAYTLKDGFRYVDRPPRAVTAVRPAKGALGGGTEVTITGSGFADGATVTFNGAAARKVKVVSSTRITAVAPPGPLGKVPVGVRNPGLPVALLEDGFTYVAAPAIISIKPATGPIEGGTKVTIKGTGFGPDAVVAVGNVILDNAKVAGDSTITIVMPPAVEPIKADISVTNPGEPRALAKGAFTYTQAAPKPTPTPTPSTQALARCRPVSGGSATGSAGSDLVLDQGALFPSSAGVTRPRLEGATFQPTSGPSDGTIRWEASPPLVVWQPTSESGSGGTITYTYTASSCSGQGRGSVAVTAP